MLTLAITLTTDSGIHLAEVGEELGAIGGLALVVAGLTPLGRRAATVVAGVALTAAFACLIVATRWGHFH